MRCLIHFAQACAVKGCSILQYKAYTESNVKSTLYKGIKNIYVLEQV